MWGIASWPEILKAGKAHQRSMQCGTAVNTMPSNTSYPHHQSCCTAATAQQCLSSNTRKSNGEVKAIPLLLCMSVHCPPGTSASVQGRCTAGPCPVPGLSGWGSLRSKSSSRSSSSRSRSSNAQACCVCVSGNMKRKAATHALQMDGPKQIQCEAPNYSICHMQGFPLAHLPFHKCWGRTRHCRMASNP
jgi:hypothetical protein